MAESLGITRQTVSNRIKNDSQVTVSELKKIEEYFGVKIFNEIPSSDAEVAYIDYYTDVFASCGSGVILFSEEKIKIPVPTTLIKGYSSQKKYSMINALGNSMAPTIDNGDRLIVEHWDGGQIQDNKVYRRACFVSFCALLRICSFIMFIQELIYKFFFIFLTSQFSLLNLQIL